MSDWNADHYLKFGDERTRAAVDLVARIDLSSPATITDLGCGPGNSTAILRQRWPNAKVIGFDNSPGMIASAREKYPDQTWETADISEWNPKSPADLVFSNAALRWIPDHSRLISATKVDGALAFQIPSGTFAEVRKLIHEIALDPKWNDRMDPARNALTMEAPGFYYDALA